MNHIDDADYFGLLREMDLRNIELRADWYRKKQYRFQFPDLRGEISGPQADMKRKAKMNLAWKHLDAMQDKQIKQAVKVNKNVCFFKRQAN